MKTINLGLIGLGTIGTGVVKVLRENSALIEKRIGVSLVIKRIADLDIKRDRGVPVDKSTLTTDAKKIFNDDEIDIVIELMGGYEPALSFILQSISNKKHVVTANKALLAKHGQEVFEAIKKHDVNIGFEASVGGGIPIIRCIKDNLASNRFESIYGIVNGTGNYILSKMTDEGKNFQDVLEEAQEKGYAEADPTFDIEGIDSAHKIAILGSLAFGCRIPIDKVFTEGITHISQTDIHFASEFGYRIKLLAIAKKGDDTVDIRVHPTMISKDNPISNINGVLNAVKVRGNAVGEAMLIGEGAGALPTASAVLSDVMEIAGGITYGNRYSSFDVSKHAKLKLQPIDRIVSKYYLRFLVMDKPGILSKLSGILGANSISIASVIQKGRSDSDGVPLVFMTHKAMEKDIQKAVKEINELKVVKGKSVLIRIENGS
ncbi:MAG TPA: homoserine dehydrogenase [Nitrospinota bacterium]|nr:homoserine dehydrogenase [Nitrospinota bacterium]